MRPTLFLCCVLQAFRLFSGTGDSLLRFSDLEFKSNFEKVTIASFLNQGVSADVIDLFLIHYTQAEAYSSDAAHRQIMESVAELKSQTEGLSDAKKVNVIYKYIHKRFFKLYQLENSFPDVFTKGQYNCVSGSAMYAIIFKYMGIPYQVVEAPQHVFLFAYPQAQKIMIETTSPKHGYLNFNEAYVKKFLIYMNEAKLISDEELQNNPSDLLFNKYYFSKNGLSIQELAGIQYSNYAYYYLEKQEYEKALPEAKKAYYLNPINRNRYMLLAILQYLVSNNNYKRKKDVENLALLCRFNHLNKQEVSDEAIRHEFGRLTYEQLITASDFKEYDHSFDMIHACIQDTALRNDVAFNYHYELARLGNISYKPRDYEIPQLKAAYDINPKHVDLHHIVLSYFSRISENNNDPARIMKDIELFTSNFDFLLKDAAFNNVKARCLLEHAYQAFMLQQAGRGEAELRKFERLYSENAALNPGERFIEKAYSEGAAFYFKKGNRAMARELLKTGMKYAPDNFGLQMRYKQTQ
jgi:hypothetical protein